VHIRELRKYSESAGLGLRRIALRPEPFFDHVPHLGALPLPADRIQNRQMRHSAYSSKAHPVRDAVIAGEGLGFDL